MFLRPPDGPDVVYEHYGPFAHLPGLEWCRIHSPTHGSFDTCIVLGPSTAELADVYVDGRGVAFMRDRFPECRTHVVAPEALRLTTRDQGRTVGGKLRADAGPLRAADVMIRASPGTPRQVPYGGTGAPVWGSRWTCWGVDLELDARATGVLLWEDGWRQELDEEAVVTVGSFGRIAPL